MQLASNSSLPPYPWQEEAWDIWQKHQTRLGHAYLLIGAKGIGLEDFAYQMTASLLCNEADKPCGKCTACRLVAEKQHPDFFPLSVAENRAEISVDQIRELSSNLMQTAHQAGYKVALIPEVEKLNTSAFNALLKTLEEPPQGTILILTTARLHLLPATIVSRCQKINFQIPEEEVALAWLQERSQVAEQTLVRALRLSWGAPLAALGWLEADGLEQDEQWKTDMQALVRGQKTVTEVVTAWMKWDKPEQVFNQFYLYALTNIKKISFQEEAQVEPKWFEYQQQILQAQRDWLGNANKQLLLESICLLTLELRSAKSSLSKVFTGQEIRRRWV